MLGLRVSSNCRSAYATWWTDEATNLPKPSPRMLFPSRVALPWGSGVPQTLDDLRTGLAAEAGVGISRLRGKGGFLFLEVPRPKASSRKE